MIHEETFFDAVRRNAQNSLLANCVLSRVARFSCQLEVGQEIPSTPFKTEVDSDAQVIPATALRSFGITDVFLPEDQEFCQNHIRVEGEKVSFLDEKGALVYQSDWKFITTREKPCQLFAEGAYLGISGFGC
jgi:hypothetical protein